MSFLSWRRPPREMMVGDETISSSGGRSKAQGVYASLITPRRANSTEIDSACFLEYVDLLASREVDGLVAFGTTGEFVMFDIEERAHALSLILRRSRVPVLVNVSHPLLEGAVSLAEGAVGAGAAGILLMPPYFFRYSQEDIYAFYMRFAELFAAQTSIYLYNIPAFTNPIALEACERLLMSGSFAGIKDSSADPGLMAHLSALRQDNQFSLILGHESLYASAWPAGADAVISGVAAGVPELIVAMKKAVGRGDQQKVEQFHQLSMEFLKWTEKLPFTWVIKAAVSERKWTPENQTTALGASALSGLADFKQWFSTWLPATLQQCSSDV